MSHFSAAASSFALSGGSIPAMRHSRKQGGHLHLQRYVLRGPWFVVDPAPINGEPCGEAIATSELNSGPRHARGVDQLRTDC